MGNRSKASTMLTLGIFLCLLVSIVQGQNPCDPNPCGPNTRCLTRPGSDRLVISCECKEGFRQGDPFGGCEAALGTSAVLDLSEETQTSTTTTTTTTTRRPTTTRRTTTTTTRRTTTTTRRTTTDRPLVFPTRPRVIGFNNEGKEITLHAAEADFPSVNENFVASSDTNSPSDLDLDGIFTEECLISEDCPNAEYCDLKTNLCKNACSLNVCAPQAECKARIHRPLCFCPPGYEGNPHVECTKSPSRAGLRFKRGFKSFILQSSSP